MTLRLGNRQFKPSLFGTILLIAGVAIGVRLGIWQIDRAEQKAALIAQFESGAAKTIELGPNDAGRLPRYQRVRLQGRYDTGHQVLLDNMPSERGQPGYRVLTPVELNNGDWLMVDRGWVPLGKTRAELPAIEVAENQREILGRLDDLPVPGVRLGEASEGGSGWPRVFNFPRQQDLERALGRSLQPRIVLLDAQQPDGYERVWAMRSGFGPERHMGYAVQWFALAAAMVVMYLVMSFKPVTRGASTDGNDNAG